MENIQPAGKPMQRFQGLVHFKDWMKLSNGKMYNGAFGWIAVLPAQEVLEFAPGERESNWIVVIDQSEEPKELEASFILLGCQVRAFEKGCAGYSLDKDFARIGFI